MGWESGWGSENIVEEREQGLGITLIRTDNAGVVVEFSLKDAVLIK